MFIQRRNEKTSRFINISHVTHIDTIKEQENDYTVKFNLVNRDVLVFTEVDEDTYYSIVRALQPDVVVR